MDRRVSGLTIRTATLADIPRVAEIYCAARLLAYDGLVPEADLIASAAPDRPKWLELLEDEGVTFLVGERDGDILVMAILEGSKLESLHVDPAAHGGGIGKALLAHCRALAGPSMELYCLAGNDRAIGFYEKAGMRQTGSVDQEIYGARYDALRFAYED
jgi:diamine N-acetyltransferase